jgi:Restriction endonuclease
MNLPSQISAHEKGNALEAAVASIENHILATSPGLREKPFLIESKKIISVAGVRHEIDILVTIDVGDGYKSVFIFECKNWEEAVGKNEIIVFSKKIDITQAQTGFFVARSFTKDAECQAALDKRIKLLIAEERDPTTAPLPYGFHGLLITPVDGGCATTFYVRGRSHSDLRDLDLKTANAKLYGNTIDLREYLCKWAEAVAQKDALSFRSERFPEGIYQRMTRATRDYLPSELVLNGRDIERVETCVKYNATIVRPQVISYYEVKTRGRVVSLGPIQLPFGPMQVNLVDRN